MLVLGVLGVREAQPGEPATRWQRFTGHPVATWVGERSCSIYLWHWPVILLVARDNPSAPGTLSHLLTRAWCVLVTVALADLTHRFVETPFRRLGFRGVGRRVLGALLTWSRRTRQVVAASAAVTAVVLTAVVVTAPDQSETARMLEANAAAAAAQAARVVSHHRARPARVPRNGLQRRRPGRPPRRRSSRAPARPLGLPLGLPLGPTSRCRRGVRSTATATR